MISQEFGEVSGRCFSPGGPGGAAGQHYIIALPCRASLSCEIKSSVPCSRDTMNSRNRLVKRINSQTLGGKTQSKTDSPKEKKVMLSMGSQFTMGIC